MSLSYKKRTFIKDSPSDPRTALTLIVKFANKMVGSGPSYRDQVSVQQSSQTSRLFSYNTSMPKSTEALKGDLKTIL